MILIEYWSSEEEDAPQRIAGPEWTEYIPAIGDTIHVEVAYRVTAREWNFIVGEGHDSVIITLSPIHEFE